jgi:hypothetical protein
MSYRYEFVAEARDGRIDLPGEIAARLRLKGIERLRVVITSVAEDELELARRGIDAEMIDRVAAAQLFDRDVATVVLRGEGAAAQSGLAGRLLELAGGDGREDE